MVTRVSISAAVSLVFVGACKDDLTYEPPSGSTSTTPTVSGTVVPPPPPPTRVPPPAVIPNPNPPTITADVRDVAVPLGAAAVFAVTATGTGLTYQWQQGPGGANFTDLAGETNATLSLASVTQAMATNQYRVVVTGTAGGTSSVTSRSATLSVFGADQVADVFVQHPPNVVDRNPLVISATGAGYSCTSTMATGFFQSTADGNFSTGAFCYGGFLAPLVLVNNTGASVAIPGGTVTVETEGTYSHTAAASRVAGATVESILQADGDGQLTSANGRHQWRISYDGNGNVSSTSNKFEPVSLVAGGTAVAATSTTTAFKETVALGAITIAPGKRINVRYTFTVRAYDGTIADFSTVPSKIKIKLPAGVTLDRNTTATLAWITN